MKHVFYLLIAVFMVSCGSNSSTSNYEKTITDNLLKGSDTKENLNFKIVELNETGNVTVADSVAYLTDEFRKEKQSVISRIELARKMSEDLLAQTKKQSDIDKYNADIAVMNTRIDSLKNLVPDNLQGYDSRNANDVLAVIVRCKYSVQLSGTPKEETFNFYLSPDGSKCYGKKGI
ncbi:hypothetical protein M2451_003147 [Dysgonomonas sp. PFB1-18]|uniref:hypothetical protein n=1 Tax=unclassified Dysgonomonas TaxID=2630389 RepID=UPI0013D76EC8|nr:MULTISPECIES: hypothetical protein [unclassified Dysgonomonas]MDH6310263.1 hypothetical protein [Dysgonomonas sp. PF1-14]MDH6340081.1 hypothetical protein [Dysgonomonas sp. PF1-16]MDH6381812.1 hypothetical protein [Dysgonomonas sp. PFB1-18]MDH6398946.1 hypothetical protein [Dysgonomonas sp. PF1-23]NDV93348.1 hypothetical protein [Dysgonomonas sp. 521]